MAPTSPHLHINPLRRNVVLCDCSTVNLVANVIYNHSRPIERNQSDSMCYSRQDLGWTSTVKRSVGLSPLVVGHIIRMCHARLQKSPSSRVRCQVIRRFSRVVLYAPVCACFVISIASHLLSNTCFKQCTNNLAMSFPGSTMQRSVAKLVLNVHLSPLSAKPTKSSPENLDFRC